MHAKNLKNFLYNLSLNKKLVCLPITLALSASATIGLSTSISTMAKNTLIDKNENQADPIQKRVHYYMHSGSTPFSYKTSSVFEKETDLDYDLSLFLGKDLAAIELKQIQTSDQSVFYTEQLPATGIIAVNANNMTLTKNSKVMVANAYDYVNLKYVRYNKKTKTIENIKYAPPPGLFDNNTWPTLKDTDNVLSTFFPTRSIARVIKAALGLNDTFSKTEWYKSLNKANLSLNFSNNQISSAAEIFNPNLRWGLGMYDLLATAKTGFESTGYGYGQFSILYRGVNNLLLWNNALEHFPNPNFKNFPALKSISAKGNQIQAIGNFNTFSNNYKITDYKSDSDLSSTKETTDSSINYYDYLKSLWENESDVKENEEVKAIKNWLTNTLPSKTFKKTQSVLKSGNKTINDYNTFLEAVSVQPYFYTEKGNIYKNRKIASTSYDNDNNTTIKATDGSIKFDPNGFETNIDGFFIQNDIEFTKGANFGGIKLAISKDIHSIDFSNNQIQRIPLSKNLFTNVNFSNNKLKYITPIALQPLPWFYPGVFVKSIFSTDKTSTIYGKAGDTGKNKDVNLNPEHWDKWYKQDLPENTAPTNWKEKNNLNDIQTISVGAASLVPPYLKFLGNNLLDFFPQQDQAESWYTWPRIANASGYKVPKRHDVITNVIGYPISHWKNQIGGSVDFYPWFNRVWIGATAIGSSLEGTTSTYIGNFDNNYEFRIVIDGDNRARINEQAKNVNLYSFFFKQLNDNKDLSYIQNYNKVFNYDLSKNKPFVLPGFNTNELKKMGTSTFQDLPILSSGDAYKSYNSHVPYILTRTLPQNYWTTWSWGKSDGRKGNAQKINVSLINDQNIDITPNNFKNIDWVSLYANANGLSFKTELGKTEQFTNNALTKDYKPGVNKGKYNGATNNGNNFLEQVLGQAPYLNFRTNAIDWKATGTDITSKDNTSKGLEKLVFQDSKSKSTSTPTYPKSVQLKIEAPLMKWNYTYNINLLANLNYTITPKNLVKDKENFQDISSTIFSKKNAFSNEISAHELALEISSWANPSSYVSNYIANNLNTALTIKQVNTSEGSLVVSFNIKDLFNNKINTISDITITGFASQKAFFYNDKDQLITSLDIEAAGIFAPGSETLARKWIYDRIGVRWIGLELNSTSDDKKIATTTSNAESVLSSDRSEKLKELNKNLIFKLNQLKNPDQYVSNVFVDKVKGLLSFTLQINGSSLNGNVTLVQNVSITNFDKFDFSIDTSSINPKKTSVYDLYDNTNSDSIKNLYQYVSLIKTTFKAVAKSSESSASILRSEEPISSTLDKSTRIIQVWDKTKSNADLIKEKLIPEDTDLAIKIINYAPEQGILSFQVVWSDTSNKNPIPIKALQANINQLQIFSSIFNWKQNNDLNSKIAFITYEAYKDKKPSKFLEALKTQVSAIEVKSSESSTSKLEDSVSSESSSQEKFNRLLEPLIDFSKTAPKLNSEGEFEKDQTVGLDETKKKQIKIGFNTNEIKSNFDLRFDLLIKNIIPNDDAELISIKNLAIKGGYKNGKFFSANDSNAPIYYLADLRVSFFVQKTVTLSIKDDPVVSATDTDTSSGLASLETTSPTTLSTSTPSTAFKTRAEALFTAAKKEWKNKLPSEWLADLQRLKINFSSKTAPKVNYNTFDNLIGFLNHILTTSTSNDAFLTFVNITDLTKIKINDATGKVEIPKNLLTISNLYENDSKAIRTLSPKLYAQNISFTLANYFSKFDKNTLEQFPFDTQEAINKRFSTYSISSIINSLNNLFKKAKVLYDSNETNPISESQKQEAVNAINALKFMFISPDYYQISDVIKFLTQPFNASDLKDKSKANKYIEFNKIEFSEIDNIEGKVKIKITINNYVNSFTTDGFSIMDKTKEFSITNALGFRLEPEWNHFIAFNKFVKLNTNQQINITSSDTEISGVVNHSDAFFKFSANQYYSQLLLKTNQDLGSDYVKLDSTIIPFNLANWSLVDTSGIKINDLENEDNKKSFEELKVKFNDNLPSFNVKKQNITYDPNTERIYIKNPFLHFNSDDYKNKIKWIFNTYKPIENLNNENNYANLNLANVVLEGFKPNPIQISSLNYNFKNYLLDLTNNHEMIKSLLPSQILNWILLNYHDQYKINNFLKSFYKIKGFSSFINPLTLGFNPLFIKKLEQSKSIEDLKEFIKINDGLGTLDFSDNAVVIFNSYNNDISTFKINHNPVLLTSFFSNLKTNNLIHVNQFNYVNTQVLLQGNPISINNDQEHKINGINYSIREATEALRKNNFALVYRYLTLNQIIISQTKYQSQLIIKAIDPDLVNSTIKISYEIKNRFLNKTNHAFSSYVVLGGFLSNTNIFLRVHLPWILSLFSFSMIGIFVFLRYYWRMKNTLKNDNQMRFKFKFNKYKTKKNK